ncbi:Catalase HPII [Virgibacillus salexigens]|uniref:catalase n=1 Tax=Virgibacillus massiliensis TaxID=1462526 RepID=A0A024QGP2_9BACI|nr:Catalase HPII [Virgibacillus massiliensis]
MNRISVRQQVVNMLGNISSSLAASVATNLGLEIPQVKESFITKKSPAVSMANTTFSPNTLRIGVIIAHGFDEQKTNQILDQWKRMGLQPVIISEKLGKVRGANSTEWRVEGSFLTGSPLLYDGLYVVGGDAEGTTFNWKTKSYVVETYNHYKPIGLTHKGATIIQPLGIIGQPGVLVEEESTPFANDFTKVMTKQRFWVRG